MVLSLNIRFLLSVLASCLADAAHQQLTQLIATLSLRIRRAAFSSSEFMHDIFGVFGIYFGWLFG
jgi:hypothetical protein